MERSKEESEFKDLLTMENNRSGLMTDGGVKQSVHKKPVILQRFHSSASGDSASSWASRVRGCYERYRVKWGLVFKIGYYWRGESIEKEGVASDGGLVGQGDCFVSSRYIE